MDRQDVDQNRSANPQLLVWETPRLQRIPAGNAEKFSGTAHPDEGNDHMLS